MNEDLNDIAIAEQILKDCPYTACKDKQLQVKYDKLKESKGCSKCPIRCDAENDVRQFKVELTKSKAKVVALESDNQDLKVKLNTAYQCIGDLKINAGHYVEAQHQAEIEKLKEIFNPRLWNQEQSEAWHKNIPNVQKAFEQLLEQALIESKVKNE